MNTFKTIAAPTEAIFKDRGSKFIAYAFPIQNADDIKAPLNELKKEHFKAVHFCYAYIIGIDGNNFRANDDGEPSGSAGRPILNQILSFGITNVCVIVVRYFGGTLLGVPGLINAYKTATNEALIAATIVEEIITEIVKLEFEYSQIGEVMKWIKQWDGNILRQEMELNCLYTVAFPKQNIVTLELAILDYNIHNPHIIITKV